MTGADLIGRVLAGRYRLIAPVGSGASAQVYMADDVRLRRRVAVKVLHPGLAGDPTFLRRFQAEAQAAAALNHPNVLAVYDWGRDDEPGAGEAVPFLVTEYLDGGSLRAVLDHRRGQGTDRDPDQAGTLSLSQGLVVALEVCRGLHYAHTRGFVHRDIKPANLLFGEDRRLRIADFGLARALAEASWTEPEGVVLGTARYASPEQAAGLPIDARSDLYSLALVLVECVTGRVPHTADTTLGTLRARIDRDITVDDAVFGPLTELIEAAGRADPAARISAARFGAGLMATAELLAPPAPLQLVPPERMVLARSPGPETNHLTPNLPGGSDPQRGPAPGAVSPDAVGDDITMLGAAPTPATSRSNGAPRRASTAKGRSGSAPAPAPGIAAANAGAANNAAAGTDVTAAAGTKRTRSTKRTNSKEQPSPTKPPRSTLAAPTSPTTPTTPTSPTSPTASAVITPAAAVAVPPGLAPSGSGPLAPDGDAQRERSPRRRRRLSLRVAVVVLLLVAAVGLLARLGASLLGPGGDRVGSSSSAPTTQPVHPVGRYLGRDLADVRREIDQADVRWRVDITDRRQDGTSPGEILEQNPLPGAELAAGGVLHLVQSLGDELVTVPKVVGQLIEDPAVGQAFSAATLLIERQPRFDENRPVGEILAVQNVGGQVEKRSRVAVVVSAGPEPRTLIDYVTIDKKVDVVVAELTVAGLVASVVEQPSESVPEGRLIVTEPAAGGQVPKGGTVKLVVSTGLPFLTVPDLDGVSGREAEDVLTAAGWQVRSIVGASSGTVIATDPPAGQARRKGSPIVIITATN
ncbi:MAG: protein kinase domain-containing protein [Acidimicrobiales bacterium]